MDAASASDRSSPWIAAVAAVLTLPPLVVGLGSGLDPSWRLGLHLAREQGLVVGRDVFFTYGPWGFLTVPLTLVRSQWIASVTFLIFGHVAIWITIGLWARRRRLGAWTALAVLPLVLFAPATEYGLLLALALACALVGEPGHERPVIAAALGAFAAAMLMIKFSMGIAALLIVAAAAGAAAAVGPRRVGLGLGAGFAVGAGIWGTLALGSLVAWFDFLSVSWQISAGYNLALERRGPLWQPLSVAVLFLVAGLVTVRSERLRTAIPLLAPALGLFAIGFKHGFVRHETHGYIAFTVAAVLATWLALDAREAVPRLSRLLRLGSALALCGLALLVKTPVWPTTLPTARAASLARTIRVWHEMKTPLHRERQRAELQRRLPLSPAILERLGDHTVDVMTVEIALMEAWDLRWTPRPVLQGYAVTASSLDARDAAFFAGPSAPERLLIDLQGLDTRHPMMDSPLTWQQILGRYEPMGWDKRFMLLARREHPRRVVRREVGRASMALNTLLKVPEPRSGYIEVELEVAPSVAGRLLLLPWKIPEIRVGLRSSSPLAPRRLVADNARHAFPLLDPWPESPADLGRLFTGDRLAAPSGIALWSEGPWAWSPQEVRFYEVEWFEPIRASAAGDL